MVQRLEARAKQDRLVVVNCASSSGPFINTLLVELARLYEKVE